MFLHLDHIPLPAVVFSSEGEKLASNCEYETAFGPEYLSRHQALAGGPDKRLASVSISTLPSGDRLLCFSEPTSSDSLDDLTSLATEITKVGAWDLDVKSGRLRRTKEIFEIYGVDPGFDPNVSSSILKLYGPEAQGLIQDAIERAISTGQGFELELPLTNTSGEDLWVRLRGRADFSEGSCERLFGTLQDITEEHRVRTRLADLVERFAFAQDSAGFGIWDYDLKTGKLVWDSQMLTIYDVKPEDFGGVYEDWADSLLVDDLPGASNSLQIAIDGGQPFDTEFRILTSDGNVRWIKATADIVRDEAGEAKRVVGYNYDITDIKFVEEKLRQSYQDLEKSNQRLSELAAASDAANRAKSAFLANMSHEIRTPMNGVVGMASLLLESELTPLQRESIDIIRKSGDALLHLINDLLDFSRVEAGFIEIVEDDIELREVVDDVVKLLAIEADSKGLNFSYTVQASVPNRVKLDPSRLRQILINLAGNAIKYTTQGSVAIKVSTKSSLLAFAISDTGPGIEPSEMETLFSPFTRGSNPGLQGGSGLGLAISQRLAKMMRGKICVQSAAERGSTFTLALPLTPSEISGNEPSVLSGCRVALTGGTSERRESFEEALLFLKAVSVPEQPQIELLFAEATPRFPDATTVMITSATDISRYREPQSSSTTAGVPYPVCHTSLLKTLSSLLEKNQAQGALEYEEEQTLWSGYQILLVEDNDVNQRVASRMLKKCGAGFQLAEDGLVALELLSKHSFDLVLMDLQMPNLDGIEAARRLREGSAGPLNQEVPVVALTAHATREHREQCFQVGMNDFLAKPLRLKDLRELFGKWLPPERAGVS